MLPLLLHSSHLSHRSLLSLLHFSLWRDCLLLCGSKLTLILSGCFIKTSGGVQFHFQACVCACVWWWLRGSLYTFSAFQFVMSQVPGGKKWINTIRGERPSDGSGSWCEKFWCRVLDSQECIRYKKKKNMVLYVRGKICSYYCNPTFYYFPSSIMLTMVYFFYPTANLYYWFIIILAIMKSSPSLML